MKKETGIKTQAPIGYLVFEVGKLLKRRFEDEANSHGITLPQWRALAHISAFEGISQKTLADAVDTDPMTMSGVLDRLEKRGLIERFVDPTDSRAKLARILPEGAAVVRQAQQVGLNMYEAALQGVGPAEKETVIAVLTTMRGNLLGLLAEKEEA